MAENKTRMNDANVAAYLAGVEPARRAADGQELDRFFRQVTGFQPRMWGTSIVGYGSCHYRYASGREGEWFLTGFSPRKGNLTLYIMDGFKTHGSLLKKLGKHKTGKSCLYVKRLADVDMDVLQTLITASVAQIRETYPS